jgi:outer membrane protein assembly factor BamD
MLMALVVTGALGACASSHQKATDSLAPDALFNTALADLQNHKWADAQELFERFVLQYPSHPRLQEARMHLGDAYYGKKEYVTAADEYSRLANDFPAGPYADDARFKVCEAYYRLSPDPELDQQYTRAALDHCQSLLAYYSTSEFAPKAQAYLTELRTKLAEKQYLTAEFYYKRGAYDSAIIYYEKVLSDYPDVSTAPRALLRLYQAYTTLRYKEEAEGAKARLLKDYPNSPEAKQLQAPAPAAK